MNIKKIAIRLITILLIIVVIFIVAVKGIKLDKLDTVDVNDIVMTVEKNLDGDIEKALEDKIKKYNFDFVVFDENEKVLFKSKEGISTSLKELLEERATTIPILKDSIYKGTFAIINNSKEQLQSCIDKIILIFIISLVVLFIVMLFYVLHINNSIVKPFNKLKNFASNIARGDLDTPLDMDKNNIFGAFTESFDIMRDELNWARENERKANESKKEMVASLSHDIKTPLASIKAMSEVMAVKEKDENERNKINKIWNKANQIEELINNLFTATMEELLQLKVNVAEEESTCIPELIKNADYLNKGNEVVIPECIISCDKLRLQQVFDNIISNSYKYAGTELQIKAAIEGEYLKLSIRDFGSGVQEEEIDKIKRKFFRGKNSEEKSGAGIGLFLSNFFMEKMEGKLVVENAKPGLYTCLYIKLA